jgi:dipeptidyl aminopeptidase/acylaminoacyl peptidase
MRASFVLCFLFIGSLVLPFASTAQTTRGWLTVDTIMRDPAWMGTPPKQVFWSDDSRWVYFSWRHGEDKGDSLYKVPAAGGAPVRVSLEERRTMPSADGVWTSDRRRKVYQKQGDIFLLDLRRNVAQPLTRTVETESDPRFTPEGDAVSFVRSGNLFRRDLSTGLETQVTDLRSGAAPKETAKNAQQSMLERESMRLSEVLQKRRKDRDAAKALREALAAKGPRTQYLGQRTAGQLTPSPDGRFVTLVTTERPAGAKTAIVPNYVTESGYTEEINARTKVGDAQSTYEFFVLDLVRDTLVSVRPDSLPGILAADPDTSKGKKPRARPVFYAGPVWSDDGRHALMQVYSQDNKDRWIVLLDVERARFSTVIDHQRDTAWISGPGIWAFGESIGFLPGGKSVWFQSEADGWSHLFTVNVDGRGRKQLTQGRFEVYEPRLSRDKTRWYFTSNEEHVGEHHFYNMPLAGGKRTKITSMEGRSDATLSPDEKRIALLFSFSNRMPDLFVMDNQPGARPVRVTDSPSEEFRAYDWRAPLVTTFKARDGAEVPVRLYKPERANGAAVIFVHGAGYLQNAHKGWSSYFREYLFHNLLADRGITVIDMDYRASAGLGRDWRTAIYRFMGGKDLEDNVDGARWLVSQHGIDPKRIGIYGGSYGGFIALMGMFTTPGVFAAGAALRPVTDWAHYNHGYTSDILNIPQEDSAAYRRSSPIYHAEGLQGALLICHGMVDVNVHYQDAVRLAQRLIELKKDRWELASYPVEDHGFVEPTSWRDEYSRILRLFEIGRASCRERV